MVTYICKKSQFLPAIRAVSGFAKPNNLPSSESDVFLDSFITSLLFLLCKNFSACPLLFKAFLDNLKVLCLHSPR